VRFLIYLSLFLGLISSAIASDEWQGFAEPFPIRDAILNDGALMLATDGGMRYRTSEGDALFTSDRGLETSVFYGVAKVDGYVYAVSEYGQVAKYVASTWVVVNRSFLFRKSRVIPGMVASAEKILVIPFEDVIAFFDVSTNNSIISLERVGDVSLSMYPPERIEIRGDSLFVSTLRGSFVRIMDWKKLAEDRRLADPDSWSRVETCVACRDSLHVIVGGKSLTDSVLFRDGVSRIRWVLEDKDYAYLVGTNEIFKYSNGHLEDITKYQRYQLGPAYEVQPLADGGVIAASPSGRISLSDGSIWSEPLVMFNGLGNELESYAYRMKVLSVLDGGMLLYHVWGMGLLLYRDYGQNSHYFLTPSVQSCMDQFVDNYSVTVGTTVAPDGSGFFAGMSVQKGNYGLLYMTKDGDVSCAAGIGSTTRAGPLVARRDGSDWVIYVSARESFDVFATGALDVIRIQDPSKNGGRLVGAERKTIASIDNRTPVDLALNEKDNVLWLVTSSGIGYMELDKDTVRKPVSMNGLQGAEYTSLDLDPHGNLWVGSSNRGAYRLEILGDTFDTLSVTQYTSKSGLLTDNVTDIAVDKVLGMVWFTHDNGVSRYKRNDLRDASTFMTDSATAKVKVYPVPFRPFVFPYVTIDNISEGARVDIYNRGGSLIRSFAGKDVHGGKVEWDGNGKNGALVAPGVYYYVVRTSKKTEKGKFLIVH
jgi:hypothetical protein